MIDKWIYGSFLGNVLYIFTEKRNVLATFIAGQAEYRYRHREHTTTQTFSRAPSLKQKSSHYQTWEKCLPGLRCEWRRLEGGSVKEPILYGNLMTDIGFFIFFSYWLGWRQVLWRFVKYSFFFVVLFYHINGLFYLPDSKLLSFSCQLHRPQHLIIIWQEIYWHDGPLD